MRFPALPLFLVLAICVIQSCSTTIEQESWDDRNRKAVVASANWMASDVGRDVLLAGGNAIDAAIATGFALAVTHPQAGNIGGGGFMVIRFPDGRATTIDFRETAPATAGSAMFLDKDGAYSAKIHHSSHQAVGVPGTVAGLYLAHQEYGSLPWSRLLQPSIDLAQSGFKISKRLAKSLQSALKGRFKNYPTSVATFSKNGTPYEAGDLLRQRDLAKTLKRIQEQGQDGFYKGETAHLITKEMAANHGLISQEDLSSYRAKERKPIRGTYKNYDIIGMPPPSSGGCCIVEMLNILEGFDLSSYGHNSPTYIHLLAEAMRLAFRDRAAHLGDADFNSIPINYLTSKDYAKKLQQSMPLTHAGISKPSDITQPFESDETTHFSIVDEDGLAVSVTYTLEYSYGSGIVVPGAGFILNNEMGDFNAKPGLTDSRGLIGTAPNLAAPRKRMLSSMSPTIIAKDGELIAVLGSPGGRTIINTVLQVALNIMEFNMSIKEAVGKPRFHHQWLPDEIRIEKSGASSELVAALRQMGHPVKISRIQGQAHCIMIHQQSGAPQGAVDLRDEDAGVSDY